MHLLRRMRVDQAHRKAVDDTGSIAGLGMALTAWTERWVPDAFIFALLFTVIIVAAGVSITPFTLAQVVDAWGAGFWDLIPFTLQMALIVITGHVLATSRPMGRVIRTMAGWPRSPREAIAMVTLVALLTSWLHWGFSLMFSAMLGREVARRVDNVDYRALAAASFLGQGSIWAQGLSSSAALQMATAGALPPRIRDIVTHGGVVPSGVISLSHTIFLWQSFLAVFVEVVIVTGVMWLVTPPVRYARTARHFGIDLGERELEPSMHGRTASSPGTWLEHSSILNWFVVLLGVMYLTQYFRATGSILNSINLNILNFVFLILGFLLHRTPARLMGSVQAATPAVWGIVLQFPFYAGIAGIITATHLSDRIAAVFVHFSTAVSFPPIVAAYSALLGLFVPSGGSKWVIEAPYVLSAAHDLRVHLGWTVVSYNLGEALANLVQPFFMLPILSLFHLSARDVMGYTLVVLLAIAPFVMLLLFLLGRTLSYPL